MIIDTIRNRRLVLLLIIGFVLLNAIVANAQRSKDSNAIVEYIQNKAEDAFRKGDYLKAASYTETIVEVLTSYRDTSSLEYARYVSDLAFYIYNSGDYEKAIEFERRALTIREKKKESSPVDYAISLYHLCDYYGDIANYDESLKSGQEAISLLKAHSSDHTLLLNAMASLICNSIYAGAFDQAQKLLSEAFELCSKYGEEQSHAAALLYTHWGMLEGEKGNFSTALEYTLKGKALFELIAGTQHPHYAYALNNAGTLYYYLGDHSNSIRCLQESVSIRKKIFGINHQYFIRSLSNLGSVSEFIGDLKSAKELLTQSIVLDELQYGKNNMQYCSDLESLARLNNELGNYQDAIELQSQAVNIERAMVGTTHYSYALSLLSLANYYGSVSDIEQAESLALEGLSMIQQALGERNYYCSRFYRSLANFALIKENHNDARKYIDKALSIIIEKDGRGTVSYGDALFELIKIEEKEGNIKVSDVLEYDEYLRSIITHGFANMSKREREIFWNNNSKWYSEVIPRIAVKEKNDSLTCRLFNDVLMSKGLTLNAGIELSKQLLSSNDSTVLHLYSELSKTNQRIESLLKRPISERYLSVDSLIQRRSKIEYDLLQKSQEYGGFMSRLETSFRDIQESMKEDEIAIEFIALPSNNEEYDYYALLISKSISVPEIEFLCSSEDISRIKVNEYYTTTSLYDLIWTNIERYFKGMRTIYFSPSKDFHRIAIEYLLTNDTDNTKRISDIYELVRLSSTKEIIDRNVPKRSGQIVLFGGIQYDGINSSPMDDLTVSDEIIRGGFSFLPATLKECESITHTLGKKSSIVLYTGTDATETAFKELSGHEIKYLHIATHGFYWSIDDIKRSHLDYEFLYNIDDSQITEEQRALSHSGLLFSGANETLKNGSVLITSDDGVLTSNEISNLNLHGVDLLVLSACQTGLGDISVNEVFGLQRGFKAAGVKTIVMSLWEVDDYATGMLMSHFYKSLERGLSTAESLKKAQKAVMGFKGTINVNGAKIKVDYSDPKYWASFIVLD